MPNEFSTPGSAVADVIQNILQRRREESRQAMVDKLNEDRYRADMANDTERLGLERRRVGSEEETNVLNRKQLTQAMMDRAIDHLSEGTDLSQLPADQVEELHRRGAYDRPLTPSVGTSTEVSLMPGADEAQGTTPIATDSSIPPPVTPSQKEIYVSSKEREKQRSQKELADYITANPKSMENPALAQALGLRAGTDVEVPISAEMLGGKPKVQAFGPTGTPTGKPVEMDYGTQAMQTGFQPYAPGAYMNYQDYYLPDEKRPGQFKTVRVKTGQSLKDAEYVGPAPAGVTGAGPAANIGAYPPQSSTLRDQLSQEAQALAVAARNTGPRAEQSIAIARASLLDKARRIASPQAGDVIQQVASGIARAAQPLSPADIEKNMPSIQAQFPNLTQKDLMDIRGFLEIYVTAGAQ